MTATASKLSGPTLGDLAAIRANLKHQKTVINNQLKAIDIQINENTQQLIDAMTDAGLSKAAIEGYTISVVTEVMPTLEDFDKFVEYVEETGNRSLLYRRVNPAAFRELLDDGQAVPGVASYEKQKINARKS